MKKMSRKEILLYILKTSIDNFVVAICLSFVSSLISGVFDNYFWYCTILSFTLSWLLCLLVPARRISNFLSCLVKIPPDTVRSCLFGGLFTNIYTCGVLTMACKILIHYPDGKAIIDDFLRSILIMYIISYLIYQLSFYLTNRLVRHLSPVNEEKECD